MSADQRAAFVSAVIASPQDDAPRLIFADALEEAGDEAYASFIRVQCELARIRYDGAEGDHECPTCARIAYLRRREYELWGSWPDENDVRSQVHAEWEKDVGPGWTILPASLAGSLDD